MARLDLLTNPLTAPLVARVAADAVAPFEALVSPSLAAYLRERVENLLVLHPIASRTLGRIAARLAPPAVEPTYAVAARRRPRDDDEPANDDGVPLSPEEQRIVFEKKLVLGVQPLARSFARKYQGMAGERDDCFQACITVALELLPKYQGKTLRSFVTFAYGAMDRRMISLARKAGVVRRRVQRDVTEELDDDAGARAASDEAALRTYAERLVVSEVLALEDDPLGDGEDRLVRARRRAALEAAIAALPDDERAFVRRYYWEGERTEDIGRSLGWGSAETSRRRHRALLDRIRKGLDGAARGRPALAPAGAP